MGISRVRRCGGHRRGIAFVIGTATTMVVAFGAVSANAGPSGESDQSLAPAPAPLHNHPPGPNAPPPPGAPSASSLDSGPVSALSVSTCNDGNSCFWKNQDYEGTKRAVDGNSSTCCSWRLITGFYDYYESAKNRYGNRRLYLGNEQYVLTCMDPGDNRSAPGYFDRVNIGATGTSC